MKPFFDHIRETLGPLSQSQVDGINALLAATDGMSTDHRAYVLATAWHETARTMQPITEFGSRKYFDKYDAGTSIGKVLGNTIKGDGYKYRGRGYVLEDPGLIAEIRAAMEGKLARCNSQSNTHGSETSWGRDY